MDADLRARLAQQVAEAVLARLGRSDPEILSIIAQEVAVALAERPVDQGLAEAAYERGGQNPERVVVTATGKNRPGIIARLAAVIDEFKGDIRDLSQTLVGDYFTTIFVVDISGATAAGSTFAELRERLRQTAGELGVHVVALHDDILSTMHAV